MFHFVSPSSSSHAFFNCFWIASHGRVLAAGLHPNSLHVRHMRLKVLFSRDFTVRSPGSWLGGSWVSALLIFLFVLHLRRDLAVMSGWLCVCFWQDLFNSPAHKLPSLTEHVHRTGCFLFLAVLVVFFWFFCLFSVVLFADLFPRWSPLFGQLGLCTGPRFLSTPQCGNIQDFAQFVQWHKHCVTTWREPRRRRTEKRTGRLVEDQERNIFCFFPLVWPILH